MTDIGDEVTPDPLDPSSDGPVVDEKQEVVTPQRCDASGDHGPGVADAFAQLELVLPDDPVAPDRPGQLEQLRVDQLPASHEPVGRGSG